MKGSSYIYHGNDRSLKRIFSHPKVIQSLIKGFVPEEWVNEIDFSTLKKMNVKHTTRELKTRENDVIWRMEFRDQTLYLIFVLELQSRVDKFMAVRLLTYVGLIYQQIIREGKKSFTVDEKLPPVFSFVYYNGDKPWDAPLQLKDCYSHLIPKGLRKYLPNIEYKVLDLNSAPLEKYEKMEDNVVVPFIELKQAENLKASYSGVKKLIKLLKSEDLDELREDILVYVKRVLKLESRYPGINIKDLEEVAEMINTKLDLYDERIRNEGRIQGRQEGRHEGMTTERHKMIESLRKVLSKNREFFISKKLEADLLKATPEEFNNWFVKQLMKFEVKELVEN